MKLQVKLVSAFIVVALVPLVVCSVIVWSVLYERVLNLTDVARVQRLRTLGRQLDWNLQSAAQGLRSGLEMFDLRGLSDAELEGVLRILFNQNDAVNALLLVSDDGRLLVPPVHLETPAEPGSVLARHEVVTAAEIDAFQKTALDALREAARGAPVVWGDPIGVASSQIPLLPIAVHIQAGESAPLLLVALISSGPALWGKGVFGEFSDTESSERPSLLLLDRNDHVLLNLPRDGPLKATGPAADLPIASPIPSEWNDMMKEGGTWQLEYDRAGVNWIVQWFTLSTGGFRLVGMVPRDEAYGAVATERAQAIFLLIVSSLMGIAYALYYGRIISRPIILLADRVLDVARGNYETQVDFRSRDEIGRLGQSFNSMARELAKKNAEIERQSVQIRNWNLELQARVETRTRELRMAEANLIHTQKLAVVAELGSGVAHELNNPLAAVLGFVQILVSMKESSPDPASGETSQDLRILRRVEEQAQRCKKIVHDLLKLSQEQIDRGSFDVVDLTDVIGTVLKPFDGAFAAGQVAVHNRLDAEPRPVWGNRAQLLQVFLQLFATVRAASSPGSEVTIAGRGEKGYIQIAISGAISGVGQIQGPGFGSGAQDQAMAQGLGMWLARKIVTDHQGTLEIVSAGSGGQPDSTTILVEFPRRESGKVPPAIVLPNQGDNTEFLS